MTKEKAEALAKQANRQRHVQAKAEKTRGEGYCVSLKNTLKGLHTRAGSESQLGMLLLAWGTFEEV